jgi:hypothetical protein
MEAEENVPLDEQPEAEAAANEAEAPPVVFSIEEAEPETAEPQAVEQPVPEAIAPPAVQPPAPAYDE